MSEALSYLQTKNLNLKHVGPNEVHFACIFCGEDEGKRGRLYVNVDPDNEPPGQFKCHLCNETGALLKLKKRFGDPVKVNDDDDRSYKVHAVLQDAAEYYHQALAENEKAFQFLKQERGLTGDTIIKHKLGWADGNLRKYLTDKGHKLVDMEKTGLIDRQGNDFLHGVITIPYLVTGNTAMIRGKQIGGKYLTPPGQKTRLYNSDVTWTADTVIVTEGEFDALVLEQLGYDAVGAPGATSWQATWSGYFTDVQRVFVCFDNDEPGTAGAEKVATNLGGKARIVHMPEHESGQPKNDPSEWIAKQGHSREDFDLLLMRAKGGLLYTVFDAYDSWVEFSKLPGIKLGWEWFDRATGGLKPTQLMLVIANTGVGKTIWCINTIDRMIKENDDIQVLFISLEQTKEDWSERALRIGRFHDLHASDREILAHYSNQLLIVEKNDLTEEELWHCVEQFEWERGRKPDVIFLDYLGYFARRFGREAYERTTDAINALKNLVKSERIIGVVPHQSNRQTERGNKPGLQSGKDSGAVEEYADVHVSLWREDQQSGRDPSNQNGLVNLLINKSRNGGDGVIQKGWIAPASLAIIPDGHPLRDRQMDDLRWALVGEEYASVMFRHLMQYDELRMPSGWKDVVRKQWPTIQFQEW